MVNTKLEAQRQTIRHYWLNGIKDKQFDITGLIVFIQQRKYNKKQKFPFVLSSIILKSLGRQVVSIIGVKMDGNQRLHKLYHALLDNMCTKILQFRPANLLSKYKILKMFPFHTLLFGDI